MILAGFVLLLAHHLVLVWTMEDTGVQESSDAYLRNVVNELQFLNGIVSSPASSEPEEIVLPSSTPPASRLDYHVANIPQTYRLPPPPPPPPPQVTTKSVPSYAIDEHYQVERAPSRNNMLLGFSPAELAAMYKKAIERGAAVKYQSLVNTINHHAPKIFGTPFELPDETPPHHVAQEPHYAYYFYPLQSFRHELTDPNGYHTMPNFKYDSAPAADTKKETSSMNPILVGISSFLGMALFFMLSLFFYPRFMHYMHFPFVTTSRGFNSELTNLTYFVTEAIDYYNNYAKMKRTKYQRKS